MLPVVLVVASIFVFLAACVCLLVPGMRLKSVAIWAVSVVLFWAGSVLINQTESVPTITAEEREQLVQAQRQPLADDLWITPDDVPAVLDAWQPGEPTGPPTPDSMRPEPELPSAPGWSVDESQGFAIALGVGNESIVTVAVSCQGSTPAVLLGLDGGFSRGLVQAVWSDGTFDHYTFEVSGPYLQGSVSDAVSREMYRKLRSMNSMTLTVSGTRRRFTDTITLDGSAAAIGSLPCA